MKYGTNITRKHIVLYTKLFWDELCKKESSTALILPMESKENNGNIQTPTDSHLVALSKVTHKKFGNICFLNMTYFSAKEVMPSYFLYISCSTSFEVKKLFAFTLVSACRNCL